MSAIEMPDFQGIEDHGYKTVYADPPWTYDDDLDTEGRGAADHYDTLTVDEIRSLGSMVNTVSASHAHLYLWTTNSFLGDAFDVVESWGYTPKTVLTWVKTKGSVETLPFDRDGPVEIDGRMGMGWYLRNSTEHLILGAKGRKRLNRQDAPTHIFAPRTEHSAKPEKVYTLIEELSDGPRLEMFARNDRDDWESWGDEV